MNNKEEKDKGQCQCQGHKDKDHCNGHHHGHHHGHQHGHSCGCSGHAPQKVSVFWHSHESLVLNPEEMEFMDELRKWGYLPISRFILSNSMEEEVRFQMLGPVYIDDPSDDMERVKERGVILKGLAEKGLIKLEYDLELVDYDYTPHKEGVLFAYFQETVEEGKKNPDFLGDTAEIELGAVSLTEAGKAFVQ